MDRVKKKFGYILYALPIAAALLLFLLSPKRYASCVSAGISLWAVSVLPSVFPFLYLTARLRKTKAFEGFSRRITPFFSRIFKVSGTGGGIFLLSALSGYPVGARTLCDSYKSGMLSDSEIFRLSCMCTTTGPVFCAGVVGSAMLSNARAGWLIFGCHILAVLLVSLLLSVKAPVPERNLAKIPAGNEDDGVYSSVVSALCVGGSIALFSCFSQMIADILRLPSEGFLTALVRGLCEMTTGCALLCKTSTPLSLSTAAFLITFGGACVLFQQLAFLKPAGVKTLPFTGSKLVQGIVCALLVYALAPLAL